MNKDKEFEHEIDPELLEEIRLWEEADHYEPTEYYFSCFCPLSQTAAPTARPCTPQLLFQRGQASLREEYLCFLAAGAYLAERDWRHDLLRHRHL